MRRGLFTEGNLHFKIDWASLVGSKFTAFDLFYFVFEGNFPSTSPRGGLYLEGWFNRGFFALPVWVEGGGGVYLEGLIHGGAYFWNFTVFDFPLSSFNDLLKKNYVDTVHQENPYNFLYNLYYIVSVYWGLNGQYQN